MRNFLPIGLLLGLLLSPVAVGAAETGVSELIKGLGSQEEGARLEAIDTLGMMGEKAAEAVAPLSELLKHDSAAVRAHAAESLGEIGAPAKSAASALVSLIGDADKAVRREAIDALRKIRPGPEVVLPLFVKLMEDAEPSVKIRALHALAEAREEAVPALVKALKNEDTAYSACLVLSEIGPAAEAAVPALMETLNDERPGVRREAIIALAQIGESSAPAVPALAKVLDDEHNCVPATFALGRIGQLPGEVEAKIEANTKSSDKVLSTVSTWAIAKLHPEDKDLVRKAVRRLARRIKDEDPRRRAAAVQALVDLDPDPEISRPIIKKVMDGADPEVLDAILDTVAGLGEKALPRMIEALKHEKVRARAAAVIARIGPSAEAAVPALTEALGDDSPETRNEVLFALAAVGPGAEAAVPEVTKALKDPDMNVRYSACYTLGKIGPAATSAEAALQKNLAGADQFLATASAWALARIHPDCPEIAQKSVPVLIKALGEPDAMTRLHAAESLQLFGPLAKDAAIALNKAARDDNADVREAAARALRAIGG